jgi:hypothetical protein
MSWLKRAVAQVLARTWGQASDRSHVLVVAYESTSSLLLAK